MKSEGIKLVRHVWQSNHTTAWETLNHCLYMALQVGIASGMGFQPKDLAEIESKYSPGYWLGEHGFERPYADAIVYGNQSFIEAFEQYFKREPFMANNVTCREPYPKLIHRMGTRQRSRIALRFSFGDGYYVTSIKSDVLVAVKGGDKRQVVKFTREKLAEMFPAPKKVKTKLKE